jgi:hypothetical protein
MKKHNTGLFAMFIALLLITSLTLTACGRGSSSEASGGEPAKEQAAEAKPEGDEVPEEEEIVAELSDVPEDESDAPESDFPEGSGGPVGDEEYTGPSDFLQEQSGKTEFKDYDEIVSLLKSGQGYVYMKLKGSDDDILAITEKVADDGSASDASVYGKFEGKLQELTNVGGYGEYPLRLDEGILYAGDADNYESYFISKEYGSIMMKDYVMRGEDDGKVEYTGFLRPTNDFDHDKNFIGGEAEFEEMIKERDLKPIVEFTKVQ